MKAISRIRSAALLCAAMAVVCLLCANLTLAQVTRETPSSEVISPKAEAKADAIEPRKPSIEEDADESSIAVDPATLLPDLPQLPKAKATMVGGTVDRIDHVRDKITVRIFGGGKESFLFDPRTQVYRGGQAVTVADLHEGERIYLDTILDGTDVFARTIRLTGPRAGGITQGVVLKFRGDRGELSVRDPLSPNPVEVRVDSSTKVLQGDRTVPVSGLVPGSLISVRFSLGQGARTTATEISVLARPGTAYTISGQVVHIDLRTGLIVLNSSMDHETYELYLPPSINPDENLHPGVTITAVANFDGTRYVVRDIKFNSQ